MVIDYDEKNIHHSLITTKNHSLPCYLSKSSFFPHHSRQQHTTHWLLANIIAKRALGKGEGASPHQNIPFFI